MAWMVVDGLAACPSDGGPNHAFDQDADKMQYGVCELDGDTFRMCLAKPGEPASSRPKKVEYKEDSEENFFVFKRVKKDEKKKDEPKKDETP